MATTEHPIALNSEQHRAFAEKVIWQTVGIVNCTRVPIRTESGMLYAEKGLGTGSACIWKDKKVILTARHVVEEANRSDLRFFLRPSGRIDWNSQSAPADYSERIELPIDRIIQSSRYDLCAIVLLPVPDMERFPLQYCNLPNGFGGAPSSGGVFLAGFPSDQAIRMESVITSPGTIHQALAAVGRGCWATIVAEKPRYFPSSYDPASNFLLCFDPSEEGSLPHGYSGTGVWYQRSAGLPFWAANPVLAGVQVSWHRESKLMICVRSEIVQQFLEGQST